MLKEYGQIIMMAMAVLVCTACSSSSNELELGGGVPVTGTAIAFSALQGEEQEVAGARATRAATPLSETGVTSFKVWGYKNMSYDEGTGSYDAGGTTLQQVFPGYVVNWLSGSSSTSNSNGWEYVAQQESGDEQTIKYWDWGAKAYRFFAVTGTVVEDTDGPYAANKTYETYTANGPYAFTFAADCSGADDEAIANNIAATQYFTRLWFSTGNAVTYPTKQFGRPVQLEFLKPFARVRFLFNYSYAAEGVRVRSKSFKPTDGVTKIALKGTVKVHYPLTGTETKEWYTSTPKAAPTSEEVLEAFTQEYIPEGTEKWYTVLPRTSQGSYTLTVNLNGADKTCTVPAEYMTWLPGYSYTYIFKITELGGVEIEDMQAAVINWSEMEGEHSVYNW